MSALAHLLKTSPAAQTLADSIVVHPEIAQEPRATRAVLAQALNILLFADLMDRVPTARAYVADCQAAGRKLVFDHGALRTVALEGMGALPAGEAAITRVLLPLGYRMNEVYPLDRLGMTGRSYTHADYPEDLPQFFLSELHPERFSDGFAATVARVTVSSRDPLDASAKALLARLATEGELPLEDAQALLPALVRCFDRQHADPTLADYELLLAESAEMAWIATEGNAFNHATDRVPDLSALVDAEKAIGRPLKETVEVSRSGRVLQTAYRADRITRPFVGADGKTMAREVPGSFFEFIQRAKLPDGRLDLAFDASNAQGIFKMTAASAC